MVRDHAKYKGVPVSALPPDDALDVGALSHLFDTLGFSYKHDRLQDYLPRH